MSPTEVPSVKIGYTCSHCGASFTPFKLPPHDCAGVRADLKEAAKATLEAQPGEDRRGRRAIFVGDLVAWTERTGKGQHTRKQGVVMRLVDGGKSVLIRVGNTLVELNMGRVTRVGRSKEATV